MNYPRRRLLGFDFVFFVLCFLAMAIPLLAQVTNAPPPFDPGTAPLPTDKSSFWEWGIAVVSPVIVWVFARIGPKVPVMVLPLLAPVVDIGLGWLMNWLAGAGLSWVDMTKAGMIAVFIRESVNQLIVKRYNGEPIKTTGAALLALFCLLSFTGCGTLEPGGAYNPTTAIVSTNAAGVVYTNTVSMPDKVLHTTDLTFDFSYSAIMAVMDYERENRAMLWAISPDIKHTLDKLRPQVVEARLAWAKARKAYQDNPVPANLSALEDTLRRIKQINAAVATAIPQPPGG